MGNLFSRSNGYSPDTDFIVKVKTGDKKGAGTDANVKIAFVTPNGNISQDFTLDVLWRDDFEAGSMDDFEIKKLPNFGHVSEIELWRDQYGAFDAWYVEWVSVTNHQNGDYSIFPIHRWVPANKRLRIKEFDAHLPQDSGDANVRKEELEEKRKVYETTVKLDGWLPQVKELPSDETFSNAYKWDLVSLKLKLKVHMTFNDFTHPVWDSYDEIHTIYNEKLTLPPSSAVWKTDETFGDQRLNHCNPTQIRLCKGIPEKFAVTEEMLLPLLEGLTLQEALDAKRLYILDYAVLKDLECANNRIVCAPFGLFFVNGEKKLVPVAIQLFQDPGEDNPVFLPTDNENTWLIAKLWFNNADASFHQSCTHLGYTHLIMEPICLGTHRSLSPSHPIFRLLAPHFLYLMAINSRGLELLISPGGWVDKCMTLGCKGMFSLIVRQLKNWRMDVQGTLPKDLEERGVADPEALPNYHYRDDALLIYKAIRNYVADVVVGFYDSADKIKADHELQEWARVLSAPVSEGGIGVPGVHGGGKFQSAEELTNFCTSVIFMGSVGHAAANFSQYDDYGFPPNYPAFLSGNPIRDKHERTEEDMRKLLPSKEVTMDTMLITRLLSMKATQPLGNFEVQYLFDENSEKAAEKFRRELYEVGKVIDQRNKTRAVPYTYLHPDEIPNSISI